MKKKKSNASQNERANLIFSGRVQGVGFRYTAEQAGLDLGLKGWVKNLPDGSVEVLCEGPRERIEMFIENLKAGALGPGIKKIGCRWQKATDEFKDFRVEFYY